MRVNTHQAGHHSRESSTCPSDFSELPLLVGWGLEEVEDAFVYLVLQGLGGLLAEVVEDTVVEDDVVGLSTLDCAIGGFAALDIGTEQVCPDVHLAAAGFDEEAQRHEFFGCLFHCFCYYNLNIVAFSVFRTPLACTDDCRVLRIFVTITI